MEEGRLFHLFWKKKTKKKYNMFASGLDVNLVQKNSFIVFFSAFQEILEFCFSGCNSQPLTSEASHLISSHCCNMLFFFLSRKSSLRPKRIYAAYKLQCPNLWCNVFVIVRSTLLFDFDLILRNCSEALSLLIFLRFF